MRFVCLIHQDEAALGALAEADGDRLTADCIVYDNRLEARGKLILANALKPVRSGRLVRRRRGRTLVTDGPFAETKEQIVGIVFIEAADLDEALAIAAELPLAETGTIEVREAYSIRE